MMISRPRECQDSHGGTPGGRVATDSFDLRGVEHPVLSFSSYYETEDLETHNDVQRVFVQTRAAWGWLSPQ